MPSFPMEKALKLNSGRARGFGRKRELELLQRLMIKAHRITNENVERLRSIYSRFSASAKPDYRWAFEPVAFDQLKQAVAQKILEGFWVEDTAQPEPVGLMLYCHEEHRAIEINVVYSELEDKKTIIDRLMRQFILEEREVEGWDVVSYAMLGKQEAFIRTISWYGFKPVGQAILDFDMLDPVSIQILKQQKPVWPGPEYMLDTWKPEYAGGVAECIYEAFSTAVDALWDPRFRTLLGGRKVVEIITAGVMGRHLPSCTTVALRDGKPVGFCFLVETDLTNGNIPLIGVHPSEKGKGLGNHLLQTTLNRCIDDMLAGKNSILKVSTTTDTDNIPAIKMYRRMGFRENYNYPHVYLTREKALSFQPGKWC